MQHDRNYYRSLSTRELLREAREAGLSAELSIAITERLAIKTHLSHTVGNYHFNHNTGGN